MDEKMGIGKGKIGTQEQNSHSLYFVKREESREQSQALTNHPRVWPRAWLIAFNRCQLVTLPAPSEERNH